MTIRALRVLIVASPASISQADDLRDDLTRWGWTTDRREVSRRGLARRIRAHRAAVREMTPHVVLYLGNGFRPERLIDLAMGVPAASYSRGDADAAHAALLNAIVARWAPPPIRRTALR